MSEKKSEDIRINLLRGKKKENRQRKLFLARVQIITGVVLVSYLVVLVIVSGIRTGVGVQLSRLEDKIQDEELAIAQLKPVESTYALVVNKYSHFDDVDESRIQLDTEIQDLVELLPENTLLTSILLEDDRDAVELSLTARSMHETQEMLDILETLLVEEEYEVIGLKSISRIETGEYQISLVLGGTSEKS